MRESEKSPEMAAALEGLFGRSSAIAYGRCVDRPFGCGREIRMEDAEGWTNVVWAEYTISGLCGSCQARVFGPVKEDDGCNGMCLTATDVGVPVEGNPVAYPHPGCPEHGRK